MSEGDPHAEVGPEQKLTPRGCVTKEEKRKSLCAVAQTTDKIPMIGLVNSGSVEYMNGQQVLPQLRPV